MLVHGLEIPLEAERAFELATENAAAITAQANLPLALVRTDWRQNFSLAWEDDFCTGLAACLNLFSGTTSCGLLGSDEDYAHLAFLNRKTRDGAPYLAVALQSAVALLMLLTATFETLLSYIGFTLSLSAGMAVAGVMLLRRREPELPRPYRVWGYPITPILFLGLAAWMVVHTLMQRPQVGLAGLATIASGLVLWVVLKPKRPS